MPICLYDVYLLPSTYLPAYPSAWLAICLPICLPTASHVTSAPVLQQLAHLLGHAFSCTQQQEAQPTTASLTSAKRSEHMHAAIHWPLDA